MPASANHAGFTTIFTAGGSQLLSRSLAGGVPNGPSRNPAVSRDDRAARLIAFESDASDLVAGDSNGQTDIFAVFRAEPFDPTTGERWRVGQTQLVTRGFDGSPANGRSYKPVVDGGSRTAPSCIAFVSDASNLVPGDTNGVADAFVLELGSGRIQRVSVATGGRQANGPTLDVAVSSDCGRVAFTSRASNLAVTRARRAAWVNARTGGLRRGVAQVYVRFLKGGRLDAAFKGLTFLASASDRGRAGNGHSGEPSLSGAGRVVSFSSNATNLERGDRGSGSDVYARIVGRKFGVVRGKGTQTLALDTRLVSATPAGRAGNGPSSDPQVDENGHHVAFETFASDLLDGDHNRTSDISRADLGSSPPKQLLISRNETDVGNGPSANPSITGAGNSVLFDTEASNLKLRTSYASDPNGVRDVAIGIVGFGTAGVESLDPRNDFVGLPSSNPSTSLRNNYIAYESADTRLDPAFPNPGVTAIYLRYTQPK